jgi:hypothetical protein
VSHACSLSCEHSHTRLREHVSISNRYQTLQDCAESYTICTCIIILSSFLLGIETTLQSLIIFLSEHINFYLRVSNFLEAWFKTCCLANCLGQNHHSPKTGYPSLEMEAHPNHWDQGKESGTKVARKEGDHGGRRGKAWQWQQWQVEP